MQFTGKGVIIDLVNGLCMIEDKIKAEHCFDFFKDPKLWFRCSMCGADFMVIPTLYHLVEQVPIGWRALKPRHLNTSRSACAYCVREKYRTLIWNLEIL